MLTRRTPQEITSAARPAPVDAATLHEATRIIDDVRSGGTAALRTYATRFGERTSAEPLVLDREALERAMSRIAPSDRDVLKRTRDRIAAFAEAQLACLAPLDVQVPGGRAGHDLVPIESAGCYAPGGRYPLPSTVLMTATTARIAGCRSVIVASPRPTDMTLAAAALSGADAVMAIGGAHAIAAMAYGIGGVDPVDIIVGPGNRWVTAAKKAVSGDVAIDMLAGPSELAVLADETGNASLIAADLLAQAEHDTDARAFLVTTDQSLIDRVEMELAAHLATLDTATTARSGLANGGAVHCKSMDECVAVINTVAPEHLEIHCRNADHINRCIRHAGGVFIGSRSAEVFGDYGFGPNHTLPTGGTARLTGGLSVLTFLRIRTWLRLDGAADEQAIDDAAAMARMEGLHAHERSALIRRTRAAAASPE